MTRLRLLPLVHLRSSRQHTRLYASLRTVPLNFDLHQPSPSLNTPEGRPILFLHGLFGSKKNNRSVCRALARDLSCRVFALDLRNHGESPHIERHDYIAMAEDVSAFITGHQLGEVNVIGHSMGAKTAMTLALRRPHLVQRLVAVDNAPVDATLSHEFEGYLKGMSKIQKCNVVRQSDADRILQHYEESTPVRQFLLSNLRKEDGYQKFQIPLDILTKALINLGDFPCKNPDESRFEKPALFIRGTRSRYVPDEVIPLIGQFFPRFQLLDIDAGHWVISEQPEAFRKAVVEFLEHGEIDI